RRHAGCRSTAAAPAVVVAGSGDLRLIVAMVRPVLDGVRGVVLVNLHLVARYVPVRTGPRIGRLANSCGRVQQRGTHQPTPEATVACVVAWRAVVIQRVVVGIEQAATAGTG